MLALGAAAVWRAQRPSQSALPERPQRSAEPSDPSAERFVPHYGAPQPPTAFPAAPAVSSSEIPRGEADLMARLRASKDTDSGLCVALAREGNRRFPDTADSPERASLLIHALASLGLASEARGEAEDMVNHYPDSDWVREIERFTGAHRHRNFRLAADGALESY